MNCADCGHRLEIGDVKTGKYVKTSVGVCRKCYTRHSLLTVVVSSFKGPIPLGHGTYSLMQFYDKIMSEKPKVIPIGKPIKSI